MTIAIFTHKEKVQAFERLLEAVHFGTSAHDCKFYNDYDDFVAGFPQDNVSAVIVARRGADGMECARNAKIMQPKVPLIWLSDDEGFGVESYRIGCAYFSAEKPTETLLTTALKRCEKTQAKGVQIR